MGTERRDKREWLRWRQQGIGGSDAAAVVGMDPFKSAMAVWLSKVTAVEDEEEVTSGPMHWGKKLEPVIIEEFQDQTGYLVHNQQARLVHPTIPHMRATIDGTVDDIVKDEGLAGIRIRSLGLYEAKTASRGADRWKDEDGRPRVPEHVQIQVQHNLAVTGHEIAWVAALLLSPTPDLKILTVERDEASISALIEGEAEFWRMVQERRPPAVDGTEETTRALRQAYARSSPTAVELTEDQAGLVRVWLSAKQGEREMAASRLSAENALMAVMGEAETATWEGKPVVTWLPFEQHRIDTDALRLTHPKIAREMEKVTSGRRFSVKSAGLPREG